MTVVRPPTPISSWGPGTPAAPALDPQSGDLLFAVVPGTMVQGPVLSGSPALQKVIIALRTQLGSCPSDPALGVDWQQVATLRPNAPATCRTIVLAGLARMVAAGEITQVSVSAQVQQQALLYEVTFFDARLGSQQTTGTLTQGTPSRG